MGNLDAGLRIAPRSIPVCRAIGKCALELGALLDASASHILQKYSAVILLLSAMSIQAEIFESFSAKSFIRQVFGAKSLLPCPQDMHLIDLKSFPGISQVRVMTIFAHGLHLRNCLE